MVKAHTSLEFLHLMLGPRVKLALLGRPDRVALTQGLPRLLHVIVALVQNVVSLLLSDKRGLLAPTIVRVDIRHIDNGARVRVPTGGEEVVDVVLDLALGQRQILVDGAWSEALRAPDQLASLAVLIVIVNEFRI